MPESICRRSLRLIGNHRSGGAPWALFIGQMPGSSGPVRLEPLRESRALGTLNTVYFNLIGEAGVNCGLHLPGGLGLRTREAREAAGRRAVLLHADLTIELWPDEAGWLRVTPIGRSLSFHCRWPCRMTDVASQASRSGYSYLSHSLRLEN